MLLLVDWHGLQLDFEIFRREERVFLKMFEPIRMTLVSLRQNKMTTCTETALYVLKFQSIFATKLVIVGLIQI